MPRNSKFRLLWDEGYRAGAFGLGLEDAREASSHFPPAEAAAYLRGWRSASEALDKQYAELMENAE